MSKVKLELKLRNDEDLRVYANAHIAAMTGNANFPTPVPAAAAFDAAAAAYSDKLDAIAQLEADLAARRAEKDTLRLALESALTSRSSYVEMTAGGDAAKILSSGFQVQADRTPTSSLAQPQNFAATMGDNAGEIDLSCNAVARAKSYIIECREQPDTAAPGPWTQVKISVRSSLTLSGMVSGKKYAFRIRALGPNDIESPWSDEAVCMAP